MRIAEPFHQRTNTLKPKYIAPRRKHRQTVKLRLYRWIITMRVIRHELASSSSLLRREISHQSRQRLTQISSRHDHIKHSVIKQIF